MSEPASHEFEVEMRVPALPERATADIVFPTWAPGSYMVRDFVRHVFQLAIDDGRGHALAHERIDKQRWRVATGGRAFRVRYRVFAFEATVRTSFLDDSHGYWNGTSVFFFVDGELGRPCRVAVVPPPGSGWRVATALAPVAGRRGVYQADDFDDLVDAPFEIGTHEATASASAARASSWRSTAAATPTAPAWSTSCAASSPRRGGSSAASRSAATCSSSMRCRWRPVASSTARR